MFECKYYMMITLPDGTRKLEEDLTILDCWNLFSYYASYCRDCDFDSESVWQAIWHKIVHPRHRIQECW